MSSSKINLKQHYTYFSLEIHYEIRGIYKGYGKGYLQFQYSNLTEYT